MGVRSEVGREVCKNGIEKERCAIGWEDRCGTCEVKPQGEDGNVEISEGASWGQNQKWGRGKRREGAGWRERSQKGL